MEQGHCIVSYGASDDGTFDDTRGLEGTITDAAKAA
jgi:hypothetical protein